MSDQSEFWKGEFGNDYIDRQKDMVKSNIAFFARVLRHTRNIKRTLEYGAGVGMNMAALEKIIPNVEIMGVEINEKAAMEIPRGYIFRQDIFDFECPVEMVPDFVYTKGLAVHIHPDNITKLYDKLYESTSKYILMAEYFSDKREEIEYRGHSNKLWKANFYEEMMFCHYDLKLIDYGFVGEWDVFPQNNLSWWLWEK